MKQVFDIHNEFGRYFDERIYKRELAHRDARVALEFPIAASHGTFATTCFLDALAAGGGPFEFKCVESLNARHRGQLYNYLLLLDLAHGKLVNLRTETVDHEFVNATIRPRDRFAFRIVADRWNRAVDASDRVIECCTSLLQGWGVGLAIEMYETALIHFLGGAETVLRDVAVRRDGHELGTQPMRLASERVAFRITAFETQNDRFEDHARRLLRHVDLTAILWINISLQRVTFTTIE